MHPVEQVEVMSTLAYRVMNTYAVQSHMDNTMMKATTIWKKVIKQGVERKKEEKEHEQEKKEKSANMVSKIECIANFRFLAGFCNIFKLNLFSNPSCYFQLFLFFLLNVSSQKSIIFFFVF